MKLTTERESLYGPMNHGKKLYFTYLDGERLANAPTRDESVSKAYAVLLNAYKNVGNTSAVRTAKDGTVLIVRIIGSCSEGPVAQVEYNRNGRSGSVSMGLMTDGRTRYCDVQEYADYLLKAYE